MSTDRAVGKASPPRRWWRRVQLTLLVAGAAWFTHFAFLRITIRPTPRPDYWAAKYAHVIQNKPGALTLGMAQRILRAKPWRGGSGSGQRIRHHCGTVLRGAWDDQRPDIRAVSDVFTSQSFLDDAAAVHRLAQTGWMVTHMPQIHSIWPYSWDLQVWCDWLLAHSRWVNQERHDVDAVIADWLTTLRLARGLDKERTLGATSQASDLWRWAASQMLIVAVEDAVQIDAHWFALEVDAILGPPLRPSQIFAGERLALAAALDDVYVSQGGDWLVVDRCAVALFPRRGGRPSRLWNLISPLFHDLETAQANVELFIAGTDRFGNLVDCAQGLWEAKACDRLVSGLDGLPARNLRSAAYALSARYRVRCRIDAAVALLAINQHRRESGCYPDRLDDLVPEYLPRLPIDCADMQPLRYRRQGDGFVLYSIAADGVDHGGRAAMSVFTWPELGDQADAVFSLARRPGVSK